MSLTADQWRQWLGTADATRQIDAMTREYAAIDEAERERLYRDRQVDRYLRKPDRTGAAQ